MIEFDINMKSIVQIKPVEMNGYIEVKYNLCIV